MVCPSIRNHSVHNNNFIDKYGTKNRIHQDTPVNYKHGLAGIGATIEYLVQEGYVEADTDDIPEDVDDRLFSCNDLSYLSMEEIFGIGYYAIWRLSGKSVLKATLLDSAATYGIGTYLKEFAHALENADIHVHIVHLSAALTT